MKIFFILMFAYLTTSCASFKIDYKNREHLQLQLQSADDQIAFQSMEWQLSSNNKDEQQSSRIRRQLPEDSSSAPPTLDTTSIPVSTQDTGLASSPAPPLNSPTEGGQQYYTVNIPIPNFSSHSETVKQTLGTVQEFGSKIVSTVGDLFSSVSKIVSGLVSSSKPEE